MLGVPQVPGVQGVQADAEVGSGAVVLQQVLAAAAQQGQDAGPDRLLEAVDDGVPQAQGGREDDVEAGEPGLAAER